jgi:hypothetical protein
MKPMEKASRVVFRSRVAAPAVRFLSAAADQPPRRSSGSLLPPRNLMALWGATLTPARAYPLHQLRPFARSRDVSATEHSPSSALGQHQFAIQASLDWLGVDLDRSEPTNAVGAISPGMIGALLHQHVACLQQCLAYILDHPCDRSPHRLMTAQPISSAKADTSRFRICASIQDSGLDCLKIGST